jgi:PTH1 family peptidyl-tRNA hydrolase
MLSGIIRRLFPGINPAHEEHDMASGAHIVIGLGNPGRNYANTRHNLGFLVVDELARRAGATSARKRFRSEMIETRLPAGRTILVKPQTYMNDSGHAVREVLNWYRAEPEEMLVVVDDLDLPFGQMRMRQSGSAGGHNGLKSIIAQTGTQAFPRLRIGIGRGPNQAKAHVLSNFAPSEREHLPALIDAAADAVELWMRDGVIAAMNDVNGRPSVIPEPTPES